MINISSLMQFAACSCVSLHRHDGHLIPSVPTTQECADRIMRRCALEQCLLPNEEPLASVSAAAGLAQDRSLAAVCATLLQLHPESAAEVAQNQPSRACREAHSACSCLVSRKQRRVEVWTPLSRRRLNEQRCRCMWLIF